MAGVTRSFEVFDDEKKGGVCLRLLDSGNEVGQEFFWPTYYGNYTSDEAALEWARVDARNRGREWVSSVA